ncbi:MAG: CoA-binding protein [Thermoanaerobaculaceae bacterium]|jgi:hypothetical protein|nr:CoA-binding protein [Thermoanaerobaculaceae bacterium]
MTTKAAVDDFVAQRTLALVGASRSGRKFGNAIYRELRTKGYRVLAVHPEVASIEGDPCWPTLAALPEPVGGVVVVLPPAAARKVVQEAAAARIPRLWLQQGSESPEAIETARAAGIEAVAGKCLLMFVEPVGWFHRFHRTLWGWLGKLPK